MSNPSDEEREIRAYLLGKLDPTQHSEIERRKASEPEFAETVEAIEAELVDDYVQGNLRGEEKRQFERRSLDTAEGQRNIEFSRAFLKSSGSLRQHYRVWLGIGAAAVILIAAAMAYVWRPRPSIAALVIEKPGVVRGDQGLRLHPDTSVVQIVLKSAPRNATRAVLLRVGRKDALLETVISVNSEGQSRLALAPELFTAGDYLIQLKAGDVVASYFFQVPFNTAKR